MFTNCETLRATDVHSYVRQAVAHVLTTTKGERVMNPHYGADIHQYVDQPDTPTKRITMAHSVFDALDGAIAGVQVGAVAFVAAAAGHRRVRVQIAYAGKKLAVDVLDAV